MKYCPNCGAELVEGARFCPYCGASFHEVYVNQPVNEMDAPSAGFALLGFFLPIVGLILYLVWYNDFPLRAKSAGKGALIGFITGIVLFGCYFIALIRNIIY